MWEGHLNQQFDKLSIDDLGSPLGLDTYREHATISSFQAADLLAARAGSSAMYPGMAFCAERDEILFGIVAGVAAKLFVVNFQI